LIAFVLLGVAGCKSDDSAPAATSPAAKPMSKEERLYEGVHSASFQLDSAHELIEAAAIQARNMAKASQSAKEDLIKLAETLESAAKHIEDHRQEPSGLVASKPKYIEAKAKALEATVPCLDKLSRAKEQLDDLKGLQLSETEKAGLTNMSALLKDATLAVSDSAKALKD